MLQSLVYWPFMKDILTYTDEEILEEAKRIHVGYGMKSTIRYASVRDVNVHAESNAEHVFGLIYLANYFLEHEPSARSLDRQKVYDMLLYHDFGEMKYGDVISYRKTQEDIDKESEAAKEIFTSLPEPLNVVGYKAWEEYENHETPEGKFCYALDKIEPLFELMDPVNEKTVKRNKTTFEQHSTKKFGATRDFPVMMRFVELICKDMKDRRVFWE